MSGASRILGQVGNDYTYGQIYICTYKGYKDTEEIIGKCSTLEPDWPYHNHPAAQQYSPSAFISLPFIPTKKN